MSTASPPANTHQIGSQHDLVALLDANLGIAFLPQRRGTIAWRLPVDGLEMSRQVSLYASPAASARPPATP